MGFLTVISGYYPRFTGILHFLISFIYFRTVVVDGGDQICSNITLMLLPITILDSNKNYWLPKDNFQTIFKKTIFKYFDYLIMLQICLIYLYSSIGKLSVAEWLDGTAIWYWFTHETFGANYFLSDLIKFLISNRCVIYFGSWLVVIGELLISFMLFVPKKKYFQDCYFHLLLRCTLVLFWYMVYLAFPL